MLGTGNSYTNFYNGAGMLVSQSGVYNTGVYAGDTWSLTYNRDGTTSTYTINDVANLFSWIRARNQYDGNGNLLSAVVNNDDGTIAVYVYDGTPANNLLNSAVTLTNVFQGTPQSNSSATWTNYFNSSTGVLNYEIGTYTSGTLAGDTFFSTYNSSGVWVSWGLNDLPGTGGYSGIAFYNSSQVLTSQFGTYDTGQLAGDSFSYIFNPNGTAKSYTVDDLTGNYGSYYTNSYSGSGNLVSQVGTWDSGAFIGDTWSNTYNANGTVATDTVNDVANLYP